MMSLAGFDFDADGVLLLIEDWYAMERAIDRYGIKTVLEFGCGFSTRLFCAKGLKVISYEQTPGWAEKVRKMCPEADIRIYDGSVLRGPTADMVFVDSPWCDGSDPRFPDRRNAYASAVNMQAKVIACHDADREGDAELEEEFLAPMGVLVEQSRICHVYQMFTKLIVGSGNFSQTGWIATDKDTLDITSYADWHRFYINHGYAGAILCEGVLEHLTPDDARTAMRLMFDFLRYGGHVRIGVPDGYKPEESYKKLITNDQHLILFNIDTLTKELEAVGFRVKPLEWYSADGEFHYSHWGREGGYIQRSYTTDERNVGGVSNVTLIIVDAVRE